MQFVMDADDVQEGQGTTTVTSTMKERDTAIMDYIRSLWDDMFSLENVIFRFFAPFLTLFRQFVFRFFLNSFVLIPCLVPLFHHFMSSASDVTRDVDDDDLDSRQHFYEKYHQM